MILSTIALLVLFASFFILFSEELRASAKRFISNSKIMLGISLFILSMILLSLEEQIDSLLIQFRVYIYGVLYSLGMFPPHLLYFAIAKIVILCLTAFIPIVIGKYLSKISLLKNLSKDIYNMFLVCSVYLWALLCLVLVVNI